MMDTYHGHVRTPADAIKLFEACRLGLLPRVQRRLSEKERQSIKSGSVFVWDEREAGMRRWTDGKSWSASRVSGSFLTYREMEGKRGGGSFAQTPPVRRTSGKTPDSGRGSDEDLDLDGEGPDGYRYKPDGLMKQSFSITTSTGQHLHLISYYSRPHPNSPDLPQPTTDQALRHIVPVKGMYPESTVHEAQGPPVTRAPMQQSPYMQPPHPQHLQASPGHRGQPHAAYQQVPPPGYAPWPPSPISTPPFPQYQAPMYNSALHPPPGPYQQHSPHIPYGQLQHAAHQHQGPTAFDRPPPHIIDPSLPPPLSGIRGMSTATAQNLIPMYASNPSPRVAQAALLAQQQAQLAQGAMQARMIDPRIIGESPRLPPVQINSPRASTPPQTKPVSQSNTPNSSGRPVSPRATTPKTNGEGTSQAQSIPSISALVHATDSVCVMSDNKSNSSRNGSKSPRETPREVASEQKTKDIPHDKLNIIGEDQRAIRVLDRKFF